jgi:hypothetical protein
MSDRPNSNAPEIVHETFEKIVGKTVAGVELHDQRSKYKDLHHDEMLTVTFTDGTRLEVQIGSNGRNLMSDIRGFKASDLSLSFVPHFKDLSKR